MLKPGVNRVSGAVIHRAVGTAVTRGPSALSCLQLILIAITIPSLVVREVRMKPGSDYPEGGSERGSGSAASPDMEAGHCSAPREITSDQLLGGADRLFIRHQGEVYTLRVTSSRKLILTK